MHRLIVVGRDGRVLRIHSVEARHAAEIRIVRGVRPWKSAFDKAMTKQQVLAAVTPFIDA